ncbi:MAG: hypothetical protein VB018_13475 [Lachnospiraceae bacterium]|nr:hypothetical protein [Lachnospiraceae bacterium]
MTSSIGYVLYVCEHMSLAGFFASKKPVLSWRCPNLKIKGRDNK